MFDVQVINYGPKCVAMCNGKMYEGATSALDMFFREELVLVYENKSPCVLTVKDSEGQIKLQLESNFLSLTPNFFGKGYQLFCSHGFITELDRDYWEAVNGKLFDWEKH